MWQYIGSIIICPAVNNSKYSLSNLFCSEMHLNINVRIYSSFWSVVLLMKQMSISQCLTSLYDTWSGLGYRIISLQFNTQRISTMNIDYYHTGRLPLTCLPTRSHKTVAAHWLPCVPSFLTFKIFLPHFFQIISTHCFQIYSEFWKLPNGSQFSNVFKKSPTTVSQ